MENLSYVQKNDVEFKPAYVDIKIQLTVSKLKRLPPVNTKGLLHNLLYLQKNLILSIGSK